jgi:hypothetical protein
MWILADIWYNNRFSDMKSVILDELRENLRRINIGIISSSTVNFRFLIHVYIRIWFRKK